MTRSAHQLHTTVELTTAARLQPEPAPAEPQPICATRPPWGAWSFADQVPERWVGVPIPPKTEVQ